MKRSVVLILVTLIVIFGMYLYTPKATEVEAVCVSVISPAEKNISDYVNADGRIKEGNKRNIYVSKLSKISEIRVSEGENVKKGQVLFSLEPISEEIASRVGYMSESSDIYEVFKNYGIELPDISSFSYISEDERVITSPIDGIVTDLNVTSGENVNPVKRLITVSDFSDLYIETLIPEAYSARVHPGEDVSISGEAFGNTVYSGKIEEIEPVAKYVPSLTGEGKTYISAQIRPNSANKLFRPELTVKAKIAVNTVKGALTLPYECIRQGDDGKEYVFCIDNQGVVYKQIIETGHELDNEVEIKKGIVKNSVVVFDPSEEVKEGAKVTVKETEKNDADS